MCLVATIYELLFSASGLGFSAGDKLLRQVVNWQEFSAKEEKSSKKYIYPSSYLLNYAV